MKIKLLTSKRAFHDLHQAVDKARRNAKMISVPRELLVNLLIDHSQVLAGLGADKYEDAPDEPPKRTLTIDQLLA